MKAKRVSLKTAGLSPSENLHSIFSDELTCLNDSSYNKKKSYMGLCKILDLVISEESLVGLSQVMVMLVQT